LRMLVTPASTSWSQICCATAAGTASTAMVMFLADHNLFEFADVMNEPTADRRADPVGVDVEQGGNGEAATGKAGITGQRRTQVADPDQRNRPMHGDAEHSRDLAGQRRHVVTDAPDAVRTERKRGLCAGWPS